MAMGTPIDIVSQGCCGDAASQRPGFPSTEAFRLLAVRLIDEALPLPP